MVFRFWSLKNKFVLYFSWRSWEIVHQWWFRHFPWSFSSHHDLRSLIIGNRHSKQVSPSNRAMIGWNVEHAGSNDGNTKTACSLVFPRVLLLQNIAILCNNLNGYLKGVEKVCSAIKLLSFNLVNLLSMILMKVSVIKWTYSKRNTQVSFIYNTLQRKNWSAKTCTPLKFWVLSCKMGVPHIQLLPCNGLFGQNFPNW